MLTRLVMAARGWINGSSMPNIAEGDESHLTLTADRRLRADVSSHPVTGSGNFLIAPAVGTSFNLTSVAGVNATLLQSSACTLTELNVFNGSDTKAFLKLFNSSATPVPTSTTAANTPVLTIPVEPGQYLPVPMGAFGKRFASGLGIALTALAADADGTAVKAGIKVTTARI